MNRSEWNDKMIWYFITYCYWFMYMCKFETGQLHVLLFYCYCYCNCYCYCCFCFCCCCCVVRVIRLWCQWYICTWHTYIFPFIFKVWKWLKFQFEIELKRPFRNSPAFIYTGMKGYKDIRYETEWWIHDMMWTDLEYTSKV